MKRIAAVLLALGLAVADTGVTVIFPTAAHASTSLSPEEAAIRTAYASACYAVELGTVYQAISSNGGGDTLTSPALQADLQNNVLRIQLTNFKLKSIQEFGNQEAAALVLEPAYTGQPQIKIGVWSASTSEGPKRNLLETEASVTWGIEPGYYTPTPRAYTLAAAWAANDYTWVQEIATYTATATLAGRSKTYEAFALIGNRMLGREQFRIIDSVAPGVSSFVSPSPYTLYPVLLVTSIVYDSMAGREYLHSTELPDSICQTATHCFDSSSLRFGPSTSDVDRRLSTPLKSPVESGAKTIPNRANARLGSGVFSNIYGPTKVVP